MASYRESFILAAISVILVSIPAASQNIEINGTKDEVGLIDTKFSDKFKLDFSTGREVTTYIDKEAKLKINESFKKDIKRLQTSEGNVKIVKTNKIINKTVKTPYGNFNYGVKNGNSFDKFNGGNKAKAEEIKRDLLNKLGNRTYKAENKSDIVIDEMIPEIKLSVEDKPEIEHFNLTNKEKKDIDLGAWTIKTVGTGTDFLHLDREIKPGEKITFYAGNQNKEISSNQVEVDLKIYSNGKIILYNELEKEVAKLEDY